MKFLSIFLLCLSTALFSQEVRPYRFSAGFSANGYLSLISPYIGTRAHYGLQFDYFFIGTDQISHAFLSMGIHGFDNDGESLLGIPLEVAIKSGGRKNYIFAGAGGIIHTGGGFLQPAILPTLKVGFRLAPPKSKFFFDAQLRGFFAYQYEGVHNPFYPPYKRGNMILSPGLGITMGTYF